MLKPVRAAPSVHEIARLHHNRKSSLGTAALGMGLLFLSNVSIWLALAGVVLIAVGLLLALVWSILLGRAKGDPWDYDPDLDGPDPHSRRDLEGGLHDDEEA